eukprot:Em0020g569a
MDVPLSEHGRKQAVLLAETLATERFCILYTSDLSRCTETASLIASRHEYLNVVADPRLRERSHGSLEGQPFSVVREAMRRATAKSFAAPDGENLDQVRRRVLDFFDSMCRDYCKMCMDDIQPTRLCEKDPTILFRFRKAQPQSWDPSAEVNGHIMVVSHGGPIDCLLRHFRDRYGCHLSSGTITPNTGVSSFLVRVKNRPRPTCKSVSALVTHDTSHLTPEVSGGALLAHDVIHLTPEASGGGPVTHDTSH